MALRRGCISHAEPPQPLVLRERATRCLATSAPLRGVIQIRLPPRMAGFDAEKSVYQAKLKEVQQAFAPASSRESEAANRPEALAELQKQISRFAAFASDTSE